MQIFFRSEIVVGIVDENGKPLNTWWRIQDLDRCKGGVKEFFQIMGGWEIEVAGGRCLCAAVSWDELSNRDDIFLLGPDIQFYLVKKDRGRFCESECLARIPLDTLFQETNGILSFRGLDMLQAILAAIIGNLKMDAERNSKECQRQADLLHKRAHILMAVEACILGQ